MNTAQIKAYGTWAIDKDLEELMISRREATSEDVEIDILFCGVCHSDIHTTRGDWKGTLFPCVPGHEIVGRVIKVGSEVSKFKTSDMVAVGCMVDSCQTCDSCLHDHEQYCFNKFTSTYNGIDRHLGGHTYGGYAEKIVVNQNFVLMVPSNLDPAAAAPLLCAGVTTWSPLKHWNVKPGTKVAVIGLGGLGHMALKFANALGADVTLFSRSRSKIGDAMEMGAHQVIISTAQAEMEAAAKRFDLIIDTVPYAHDINPYIATLNYNGTLVLVGYLGPLEPLVNSAPMIMGRKSVAGSVIGGIKETQEMLDFCGEKGILPEIEMIKMEEINTAYERMLKIDVKYRFVIDMGTLKRS
jgi:uncharacterized zinc-type alcohol dehydrogenase-like protein